jgi:excisionase family DNA binding protein
MLDAYLRYHEVTKDATAAAILVLADSIRNAPSQQVLLTAKQAGAMLGVSVDKIYDLAREGHLAHKKIGRLTRFSRDDLTNYQRQSEEPVGPRMSHFKRA